MSSETFYICYTAEAAELSCFLLVQTGEEREGWEVLELAPGAKMARSVSDFTRCLFYWYETPASDSKGRTHTLRALTSEEPATDKKTAHKDVYMLEEL